MNALVMLLPALSLAASAGVAQQEAPFTSPVARIVIAPHVRAELRALADTMELETVRCLIGVVAGDSAVIDLAWQPQIQEHSANTVRYRSCPLATIAHWHNHPWLGEGHPEDACYLSRTDIEDALEPHAPPLQFVQVNAGVMCWWTRLAIAQAE